MATQFGRTVSRWTRFILDDSAGTLREIPIDSLSVCGITFAEKDTTAFQDAVANALPDMPSAPIDVTGPFDTAAAVAIAGSATQPALSGSHTVLAPINGLYTPLALGILIGIGHYWEAGEPVFGISGTAANGYVLVKYTVDLSAMKYSASFRVKSGSAAPAWGTAIIS
jgi:hypothetical protein